MTTSYYIIQYHTVLSYLYLHKIVAAPRVFVNFWLEDVVDRSPGGTWNEESHDRNLGAAQLCWPGWDLPPPTSSVNRDIEMLRLRPTNWMNLLKCRNFIPNTMSKSEISRQRRWRFNFKTSTLAWRRAAPRCLSFFFFFCFLTSWILYHLLQKSFLVWRTSTTRRWRQICTWSLEALTCPAPKTQRFKTVTWWHVGWQTDLRIHGVLGVLVYL